MAKDELAKLADHALAVEDHAEQLATGLAKQGAEDASKLFTQCAKAAREVVKQLPAAPGKQPEAPEEAPAAEAEQPPEEAAAEGEAPAPAPRGRTPYESGAKALSQEVQRKRR